SMFLTILNTTANATSPYPVSLTATLRPQSNLQPENSSPDNSAPLLLLGATVSCPSGASGSVDGTGNASLTVYGYGAINGCPPDLAGSSSAQSTEATQEYVPAWSSTQAYVVGNIVWFNGKGYRATAPSTNVQPPNGAFWQLLSPQPCADIPGCVVV